MTAKQSTAYALRVANRAGAQRRVPGGELRSADVALALARRKAADGAAPARLLAGLLSKRGAK